MISGLREPCIMQKLLSEPGKAGRARPHGVDSILEEEEGKSGLVSGRFPRARRRSPERRQSISSAGFCKRQISGSCETAPKNIDPTESQSINPLWRRSGPHADSQ
jgi:hypothetical protein